MRGGARPLLCEFHAHTTWSDGELSLGAVVDLYGRAASTSSASPTTSCAATIPGRSCTGARASTPQTSAPTSRRSSANALALSAFGLLLVPGFELTYNDPNPDRAGHAVAVGLRSLVGMDDGPPAAMEAARAAGAAVLVAHPHDSGPTQAVPFPTCYFVRRWRELGGLFDRVELFNGRQLFSWVAEAGLPAIACGDLHRAEHLPGWTTLVPCEQHEDDLVGYLRSSQPVFVTRLEQPTLALAA
jgi:processive 1,2-diacylglycerol beta-glucosyltransferase